MSRPSHGEFAPGSRRLGAASTLTRREVIEIAYSTMLGAGLAALGAGGARAAETSAAGGAAVAPRAKSVLFVFLFGGPSHLDTFDPKPNAPAEYRSEFAPIGTAVPGLQICEHLPEIAR